MEEFCENLVAIKKNTGKIILIITIWVAAILIIGVSAVFISYLSGMAILISAGALFAAVYLTKRFGIEYETIITNGEVDVDCIIAKSRRKRVLSFNCKDISDIKKGFSELNDKNGFNFCNADDSDIYTLSVNHRKRGNVTMNMQITERMVAQINPYLRDYNLKKVFEKNDG